MKIILISLSLLITVTVTSQEFKDCQCYTKQKRIKAFESYVVEEKPVFLGGDAELMKYVAENVKYPKSQIEDDLQTTIYVKFIIGKKGKIKNACIMRPLYPDRLTDFEREFLKVIANMPVWKPGEKNGKKVAVYFIIPMHISLQF